MAEVPEIYAKHARKTTKRGVPRNPRNPPGSTTVYQCRYPDSPRGPRVRYHACAARRGFVLDLFPRFHEVPSLHLHSFQRKFVGMGIVCTKVSYRESFHLLPQIQQQKQRFTPLSYQDCLSDKKVCLTMKKLHTHHCYASVE